MKTKEVREVRFEMRLSVKESNSLERITRKMGKKSASDAVRRLMEMYEKNEMDIDTVLVALREFEKEKVRV